MNESLEKLYQVLSRDGFYTKSFEEFAEQFNDPAYQEKVFGVVSREGYFTKSREEFLTKYAPKKKDSIIQPTEEGHHEEAILGLSPGKIKELELSEVIIEERKRVLTRRSEVGRTGVYLRQVVDPDVGVEKTLDRMAVRDSILRKKIARS